MVSFSIAFCCCILVYLFVEDEFAFDKHNSKYEQIYRLNVETKNEGLKNCSFPGVFHSKISSVPGIEKYTRLFTFMGERNISINKKPFIATSFLFADPEILDILDFDFIAGNPDEALTKPLSMVLTESNALKYFGNENPIGNIIRFDNHDFTVTGVVKDLPRQSHISMNFLASVSSYQHINENLLTKWYISAFSYYFLVPKEVSNVEIENQLADIYAEGLEIKAKDRKFDMYLEPLGDIHLKSVRTRWDDAIKGDINVVYGLIVIVLLVLGIAITNYINNLTAQYRKKIKETGIRKINGASRFTLALEQGTETFFLILISISISVGLASIILPHANSLVGKYMEISFSIIGFLSVLLISTTLLSALYPILFFNSFSPSDAIKNQINILKQKGKKQQQRVRGAFVTFQLGIATFLIIATIVINNQLQLVLTQKTGFDKENTLIVKNPYGEKMNSRYELFKSEILKIPLVEAVGVAQNVPGGSINNYSPARLPGQKKEEATNIGQIPIDHGFLSAVGANFIAGRNFDSNITSDKKNGIVINQSAVEIYNLHDPVGKRIAGLNNASTPNGELEIIGVIEDMQYFTLRENAKPVMYFIREWGYHNIVVRLGQGDYSSAIKSMKNVWASIAPNLPFSMQFMDDRISANYKSEINAGKVISILSGIAILLSILGIFGMISFTIQHRTKEIGIRKVNGAKTKEIMAMLNTDFLKWVVSAFVVACPIAYYAMNKWLENFAYKTELSWWIFVLAGFIAFGIALLTVSVQSWRAATRNPVESLRYE